MTAVCLSPALLLFASTLLCTPVQGGKCWSATGRNGRCTDLLSEKISREECCASSSVATAWSSEDLDSGSLFFWRVLSGGVPCTACKESCSGVQCGEGKKCVLRRNRPKCVCSPDCRWKSTKAKHRGPVCGTDGRSYRTICRLRKRACRRKTSSLAVEYYGHCQRSCDRINCPAGKNCLLDQNMTPHCVRCAHQCPTPTNGSAVCGTDGVTYLTACHLREAACHKGKAIPVGYKGHCKNSATCGVVKCKERQSCLTELPHGTPRCVSCSFRCPKMKGSVGSRRDAGGPICGSNNRSYHSWCHMLRDSCATGYVIDAKFPGTCEEGGTKRPVSNTVLEENQTNGGTQFS